MANRNHVRSHSKQGLSFDQKMMIVQVLCDVILTVVGVLGLIL